jgi:ribosomal protein L13E
MKPSRQGRLTLSAAKKKRKGKQVEEEPPKQPVKEKAPGPTSHPPLAIVEVRHDGRMMQRQARGYSRGEVVQANLEIGQARRWGVLVDDRRRSVLQGNIASLRTWAPVTKKKAEERAEGELRKIERAAEYDVRRAEKEVEKVEKEVVEKVEALVKRHPKPPAKAKKEAKKEAKKSSKKKATTKKNTY